MESLILYYQDQPVREFPLRSRPLEIGSGTDCDVVIHDADVAERYLLVQERNGTVVAYDLTGRQTPGTEPMPFPAGSRIPIGTKHTLVRVTDVTRMPSHEGHTEPVQPWSRGAKHFSLLVGEGSEARRIALEGHPIHIGSDKNNDVVLCDRTVSHRHCRLDPLESAVVIKDLDSRNGTFVEGIRVSQARLTGSNRLRLGRSDLILVEREEVHSSRDVVATSPSMLNVVAEIERFAQLSWPVLILGESGVGKENLARALHQHGPGKDRPFVALNAGGLPRDLVESELFGHTRGAFTGAVAARRGAFEQAHGGTLFLDEIGELPLEVQSRLLRILETGEVRRVGAETDATVHVRLVCATHRDLRAMVSEGTFRQDLYYRLARLVVQVPPLRDRPEDIPALSAHFLKQIRPDVGERALSSDALVRLHSYPWPGNARELRNVLSAAAAVTASATLESADIERALAQLGGPLTPLTYSPESVKRAIEQCRGNVSAAARALGLPRTTLRDRLRSGKKDP